MLISEKTKRLVYLFFFLFSFLPFLLLSLSLFASKEAYPIVRQLAPKQTNKQTNKHGKKRASKSSKMREKQKLGLETPTFGHLSGEHIYFQCSCRDCVLAYRKLRHLLCVKSPLMLLVKESDEIKVKINQNYRGNQTPKVKNYWSIL